MALKSTIYKTALAVADIERGYYADHALTLACHPSETEERLMVRVLAFALFAAEGLDFGRGLSSEDEPALWRKALNGRIEQWIEVGLPDERLLRRAAGRADEVILIAYGARALDVWWAKEGPALRQIAKLRVLALDAAALAALGAMAARNMTLQFTLQEGEILLTDGSSVAQIALKSLKP